MGALDQLDRIALDKEIQSHLDKATELACKGLEQIARKILVKQGWTEFVLTCGDWYFKDDMGNYVDSADKFDCLQSIFDFTHKWKMLKITYIPMRFTANGPKITEW